MFTISLYGTFSIADNHGVELSLGRKSQALVSLLVTSPNGTRTRAFLQAMLWENAAAEQAATSLRGELSRTRKVLNKTEDILFANRERVSIDLTKIRLLPQMQGTVFLEGLDIPYLESFEEWLTQMRMRESKPARVVELFEGVKERRFTTPLPRVAVLPLSLRNADSKLEIFGDIVAEELTRQLSLSNFVRVISHLSTRQLGGRTNGFSTIRQRLGCDYLLSGSLVSDGGNVRLILFFQNARLGTIVWSETITENVRSIIYGSSEALASISSKVVNTIVYDDSKSIEQHELMTAPVYRLLMGGISNLHSHTKTSFARAFEYLNHANENCENHALPLSWLAFWHWMSAQNGLAEDRKTASMNSRLLANEAIDRDPSCGLARAIIAMNYSHIEGNFEMASKSYQIARKIAPNEPLGWLLEGAMYAYLGKGLEAVEYTECARNLSPLDPQKYYIDLICGTANLVNRSYDRSLELANTSLELNNHYGSTHRLKVISLVKLNRLDEARAAALALLKNEPNFCIENYRNNHASMFGEVGEDWANSLRKAGIY